MDQSPPRNGTRMSTTAMNLISESVSWEQHYESLVNPALMTGLLHEAIPVLRSVNWRVEDVTEGYCRTVLPLNTESTNQHGTHQAALISLSADYTGGLALATLLRGVPLAGVHKCTEDESASLWLAQMNVKYKRPSSGHLEGVCTIPAKTAADIRKRYDRGSRVLASLEVEFYSDGALVAVAEMKYFAQPSFQLTPTAEKPSRSALYEHKLKASARMIAGIRAMDCGSAHVSPDCKLATIAAGPHGKLLAARLQSVLPQLKDMVLARTRHIDETIDGVDGLKQVILLGAGLDMRSIRHAAVRPGVKFFEADLPEMLAERNRVAEQIAETYADRRFPVEVDFKRDSLIDTFEQHPEFDREVPTAVIYEGCSMYFTDDENRHILSQMRELLQDPRSVLWADFVTNAVAVGRTNHEGILKFLDGMTELGESFIFGVDEPDAWLKSCGFREAAVVGCGDYLADLSPVYGAYNFGIARP